MITQELEALAIEEREVDKWTNILQETLADLAKDETNNNYSYVSFDEIKAANTQPKDNEQPFLVIRAPKGTLLEVPNAESQGVDEFPHKIKLTSQNEEIYIYVVSNENQSNEAGGEVGRSL